MSHILGNNEVFVNNGDTIWAGLQFTSPTPIDGVQYLSWQPMAFWTDESASYSEFSWGTERSHTEGDICEFDKLVTNTGTAYASFMYYYEYVP